MTSRRPYLCSKTMKRRPFWCTKTILWELNSFLIQTLSFVSINLHICWPRELLCFSKIKPRWWIPFITYTGSPRKKMRSSILIKCLPPYIIKVSSRVKKIIIYLNLQFLNAIFVQTYGVQTFFLC